MDHGNGLQDERDARARARSGYRPAWHPVLAADEVEPGVWLMTAQYGVRYAIIRMLEIGGERGYRVTTYGRPDERTLIGYYRTLRAAASAGHMRYLREARPAGTARPGGR
ncbi:MAG TPA: hypothetical protein VNR36_11855 [Pseudolysinimonas sp.]|nr:hypothetical protein [Pseudolysinimonas sp.]